MFNSGSMGGNKKKKKEKKKKTVTLKPFISLWNFPFILDITTFIVIFMSMITVWYSQELNQCYYLS